MYFTPSTFWWKSGEKETSKSKMSWLRTGKNILLVCRNWVRKAIFHMFSVSHYGFFAFNVDNKLFTGLTGNKKVCFLAVTYHCDIYVDAKCNGYRRITSSAYRLVPYNPCFYNAVLSANGRYISGKIKADSLRCQTGSLSFLSALTSPS